MIDVAFHHLHGMVEIVVGDVWSEVIAMEGGGEQEVSHGKGQLIQTARQIDVLVNEYWFGWSTRLRGEECIR